MEAWGDYVNLGKTHSRTRIQIQICLTPRTFQKSFPLGLSAKISKSWVFLLRFLSDHHLNETQEYR